MTKAGTGAVESARAKAPPLDGSLRGSRPEIGHVAMKGEAAATTVKRRASTILHALEEADAKLVGKAVVLADGKAGTVEAIGLDEVHGLRVSIKGHFGKRPVSTIKFAQS